MGYDGAMQTWIDFYIKGARESLGGIAKAAGIRTDLEAMRVLVAQALARPLLPRTEVERTRAALLTAMAPLVIPEMGASPICARLDRELVEDFAGAAAPDTPEPRRVIEQAGVVYLDLPHRSLLVGDRLELRAVIIKSSPTQPVPLVVAVLTEVGTNPIAGRYSWGWGRPMTVEGADIEGLDREVLRQQVEDLASLAILYWSSVPVAERAQVPHIPEERLAALKPDKQAARQKTHSIFQVVDLKPPADRFGRTAEERGQGGWKLGVRVRVRGHFRWQPWGEGRKLRRLQWVRAHERGPKDAEKRPELHVLRARDWIEG